MSGFKNIMSLLFCCALFACSSTEHVNNVSFSDNGYQQGYVASNYSHTQFTPINANSNKKPLPSDHQLMMSLLNRPMTEDQAMMLAFSEQRTYQNSPSTGGVLIKGSKASDQDAQPSSSMYADLIAQDINAVTISAPPQ